MKGHLLMSTGNEIKDLYDKISAMTTSEFTELLNSAQTSDERDFYFVVFNAVLQQKQRKLIQANIY